MSKPVRKLIILIVFLIISLLLGISIGSTNISLQEIMNVFTGHTSDNIRTLILNIRLPRVVLAMVTGATLAVSGSVLQSVLENPLASPFGLGISAGAGLGATIVMVLGLSGGLIGFFIMPVFSFVGGLLTVLLALLLAESPDTRLSSYTIVLIGMVISLFISAIIDLISTMSPDYAQRIGLWQLGSFAVRGWRSVFILTPVFIICFIIILNYANMLDVMTFGDEQAIAMGIDIQNARRKMITLVSVLTGTAVAFSGIIGFIDLVSPHIARRLFGASHKWVLPGGALLGGSFMILCDLISRTLAAPREVPVGSVTAILGSPFFLYIFLSKRNKKNV